MPTFSGSDLIVPALSIIEQFSDGIGTAELSKLLRRQLRPSGDDLIRLENRQDDRFSQKVRNLKSHDTLERKEFATFVDDKYSITAAGRAFLIDAKGIELSLKAQGFSPRQRKDALDKNYSGIVIEEGELTNSTRATRKRSAILRRAALKHFSDASGSIRCEGCGFQAEQTYGPTAKGMIEIHHVSPLFLNDGTRKQIIDEALRHVVPLCPNCHRIVHRKPGKCMTIAELQRVVDAARA